MGGPTGSPVVGTAIPRAARGRRSCPLSVSVAGTAVTGASTGKRNPRTGRVDLETKPEAGVALPGRASAGARVLPSIVAASGTGGKGRTSPDRALSSHPCAWRIVRDARASVKVFRVIAKDGANPTGRSPRSRPPSCLTQSSQLSRLIAAGPIRSEACVITDRPAGRTRSVERTARSEGSGASRAMSSPTPDRVGVSPRRSASRRGRLRP